MSPNDAKAWFELLKLVGMSSGWILFIAFIYIFVKHTEKIFLWVERIARVYSRFSTYLSKATIANQVRGNVLKVSKTLAKENSDILPYDLKVEWVKEENKETFMKNGQVIIRMSQNDNPSKNLVIAIAEYVKKGLMPKARTYVDAKLLSAADLAIMRKLLGITQIEEALDYFDDNILSPAITDDETKVLMEHLFAIDNNGMFITILLNEYVKAARKVFPNPPDPCMIAESKEFLSFLHGIATKEPGKFAPTLAFNREYYKVTVPLALSNYTDRNNFINELSRDLNKGIETIYIFGLGGKMHIAKEIAEEAMKRDVRIRDVKCHQYVHKTPWRKTDGICVEIRTFYSDDVDQLA
ncbi:MAG: hypothetical protein ACYCVD_04315 [Desulfitobacteriaceae bacterium]